MNYQPTRRVVRQPNPWLSLPYMDRAVEHLVTHYRAGLPLKPGGRKTSITLKAFDTLRTAGRARTMLVIAPKRVARQVWAQEGSKWDDFRHLKFAQVIGDAKTRRKALESGADVYLINYENIPWLTHLYMGRPLPFDVIVFDELTKMQNAAAERHKALRPRMPGNGWRWGLTGSLFAKGHMSIFGQQLILDDGAALGKFITHYRDTYFTVGFNGFDYDLMPGAERRIVEKLAPYWFYMDESEYSQLPPLVDVPHIATMEPQQKALYERMKKDALISIGADVITAANAGAVYSKLAQLANGAVYREGHTTSDDHVVVHDLKIEMLEEILDELDGEPLLVAYEFQSDLLRLQNYFGKRFGGTVPYLGAGTTNKQEDQWVAAWNARELPLLLAHPQSAGHGLNMQEGQAYNVAWFSVTWDWELYDQFIRRVRRSGNEQARIFNHLLIIRGTIDEEKLLSVTEKDFTERRLITALNTQLLRESQGTTEVDTMVAKLSRPETTRPPQGDNPNGGGAPAGWGKATVADQTQGQRERIQDNIAPQNRSAGAASAFTGGVADTANRIAQEFEQGAETAGAGDKGAGDGGVGRQSSGWGPGQGATTTQDDAPPKATRTRKAKDEPEPVVYDPLPALRADIVRAIVQSDPEATVDDIIEAAKELMAYIIEG